MPGQRRSLVCAAALACVTLLAAGCSAEPASEVALEHPRPVETVDTDLQVSKSVSPVLQPAVYPISSTLRTLAADNRLSPLSASRSYAFPLLAALRAHRAAPENEKDAAAATAAAVVASRIYTHNPTAVQEIAVWTMQYRNASEETVDLATRIGEEVADQASRGYRESLQPEDDLPVTGMWDWKPTGKARTAFEQPKWGAMTPIADVSACDIPAPDTAKLTVEVQQMMKDFTPQTQSSPSVLTWLGGPGSPTPPGQWLQMAESAARAAGLNSQEATEMLAASAVAGYDAGILVWREKKEHHIARPETVITALTGTEPLMIRETPPHPSYPSGHAGFSGAGGQVIKDLLGNVQVTLQLPPDNGVPAEAHTFDTVDAAIDEAVRSRVLAGFHYPEDGAQGVALGSCVGKSAVAFVRSVS